MAVTLKNGKPITASRPQNYSAPPVRTNAQQPSRDAERQILQPPAPFANPQGPAQAPTGRQRPATWGVPYGEAKPVNARPQSIGTHIGVANTSLSEDQLAAIGETRNKSLAPTDARVHFTRRKR